MFDLSSVMFAFVVLAILLLMAIYIKQKILLWQRLYLTLVRFKLYSLWIEAFIDSPAFKSFAYKQLFLESIV